MDLACHSGSEKLVALLNEFPELFSESENLKCVDSVMVRSKMFKEHLIKLRGVLGRVNGLSQRCLKEDFININIEEATYVSKINIFKIHPQVKQKTKPSEDSVKGNVDQILTQGRTIDDEESTTSRVSSLVGDRTLIKGTKLKVLIKGTKFLLKDQIKKGEIVSETKSSVGKSVTELIIVEKGLSSCLPDDLAPRCEVDQILKIKSKSETDTKQKLNWTGLMKIIVLIGALFLTWVIGATEFDMGDNCCLNKYEKKIVLSIRMNHHSCIFLIFLLFYIILCDGIWKFLKIS